MSVGAATSSIDIVVPVYNAPSDLRRCVDSVLQHTTGDYALVLIDDASTDPGIGALFAELSAKSLPQLTLLRNDSNLGFTGTANRGMTRSRADIVLLNSDAIVTHGWLDALVRCAASDARIGTITPFSNNAEICSFPNLCENQVWPEDGDPHSVRVAIQAAAVPYYPEIPTGVGFCMFVRRALIDAVGAFDSAFGAGYGEENDFCRRAHAAGFGNVLCDDAFVLHTGGRSFDGAKATLGERNTAILLERHPDYLDVVRDFIERDPLKPLREAALTAHDRLFGTGLSILHVMHGGGGTESHVRTLIDATRGRLRHTLATVVGDVWRIESHRGNGSTIVCQFGRREGEPLAAFLRMLGAAFGIDVIHLHNISGNRERFLDGIADSGIPYGYTVHDASFTCPTITLQRADGFYCGAVTEASTCQRCLSEQQGLERIDIARWRERHAGLVAGAAFFVAPSTWAAAMFRRYFPPASVQVIEHGLPVATVKRAGTQVVLMPDDDVPTVAVLGAIGPDKGARRIERLVQLSAERDARIRFVVIGYLDRQVDAWQSEDARLTINGRYDSRDLPALLDYYRASLVLFPSAGPETFAFTLSEAWAAGRVVLVPPIGALAQRVADHRAGFVMSDDEWHDEGRMLDRILALLDPGNVGSLAEAAAASARVRLPTLEAMAEATHAIYREVAAKHPVTHDAVDRARVAEAFGYRPWGPPEQRLRGDAVADMAIADSAAGTLMTTARRLRQTSMGRLLYRLMPPRAVDALKARLR
ncbi:MAG TPA: glycosyltransferase [Casimicrobiaceae bacterium]|nr:glycosyltransferase [Casimicrobiaceae bacterium]